ncbi:S41 family peptidase [Cytobacillus kochii]|uniref:Tail specific protease domain-containing protein n=1 Tax=Cytobacillus kochii TaxID=859143 RepID=A0A248TPQ8_9BACI|nr:S41 family peptidase [Cytobacillus kochii]ASV70214.1 hypothetical protein CKF48_23305 [Cytobacillus kochii]
MANNILTKEEIFKDIQEIMKNDYAGCIDKKSVNRPEVYIVSNGMSDLRFEETIQDYLLDFRDGHLWFSSKDKTLPNRGFSVRRYKNALYVTESNREQRLLIGDKILRIDDESISNLAIQYYKRLEEKAPERQRWDSIIRRSESVQVERDGKVFEITLAEYEKTPYEAEHTFKLLDNKTAYIKITDFAEEKPIVKIVRDNQEDLSNINNLILDVRVNHGGNDSFYFPLLHYVFDKSLRFSELFFKDEIMYTNYTKRNCDMWIQELQDYLKQDLDSKTSEMLKKEINTVKKNYGKGFLEVPDDEDFMIKGNSSPDHVYVLSDYYCGSSGDTFVSNLKKSSKVTVVGRPTMGIMDYFNVVTIDYGNFDFGYGISKMHSNYYINGKGVEPHIYIPWTPDHLKRDVDLEYVLDCIKNKMNTFNLIPYSRIGRDC